MQNQIIVKKGNTEYKVKKGRDFYIIFSREVFDKKENCTSIKENFSIDLMTYETYCNRTGKQSYSVRKQRNLIERIERIFSIDVYKEFFDLN